MAAQLAVNQDNFKTQVLESDVPVLVDFWATWCPPCVKIGPIVEEMATTYAGRGKVLKVDVDADRELAEQFQIMSIPALLIFKNGQVVDRMVGAGDKATLQRFFEQHLN
jgi:thioredoxin 1